MSEEIHDHDEKLAASKLLKLSFLTHHERKRRFQAPKKKPILNKKRRSNGDLLGSILSVV